MSTFIVAPLNADTIQLRKGLVGDERLSAEAIGVLCWTLACYWERPFTIAELSHYWNQVRPKEKHIGPDRMRRLANEWNVAGYMQEQIETDETGKITGKSFTICHGVERANPIDLKKLVNADPVQATGKKHEFPAAEIFQSHFNVDLDLDAMQHLEREVAGQFILWGQVCADHYNSMTAQQKDSITYKTRAIKFCLEDIRARIERSKFRATKTPYTKPEDAVPTPKKKTFADYIDTSGYRYGSAEYETFKERYLQKAHDKGNLNAIEQVDEYERLQDSLATIQNRKGVKQK